MDKKLRRGALQFLAPNVGVISHKEAMSYQQFTIIFIILFSIFEINIVLQKLKGLLSSFIFTLILLFLYVYFVWPPSASKEELVVRHIIAIFIIGLVPILSTVFIPWFIRKLKFLAIHSLGIILSLINAALLPFVALITSCFLGLGCI